MMMTRDSRICLCRQLFDSITQVKRTRRKSTLPLPILITDIVKTFLTFEQFAFESQEQRQMALVENVFNSYRLTVRTPWGPHMLQEHIIRVESPPGENEEGDTFWTDGPPFDSQSDFNNRV